jgi:Carboxypeptidase regulatory-like domain
MNPRLVGAAALGIVLGGYSAYGQAALPASLSGRILSTAGDPLKGANVRLRAVASPAPANTATTTYTVETGDKGEFRFENLPAGRYRLDAERSGYVSAIYRAPVTRSAEILVADGNPPAPVELRLAPEGVVAGRVLNANGEAFPRARVLLYRWVYTLGRRQLQGAGATEAGADGAFSLGGLAAGVYYVAAQDVRDIAIPQGPELRGNSSPEERYTPTFYPSGADVASAVPIRLEAGASFRVADIRMRKSVVYRISGRVVDALSGEPLRMASITYYPADPQIDLRSVSHTLQMGADGAFSISGVPPGTYVLQIFSAGVTNLQSVAVADRDIAGLILQVSPGFEVAGRIIFADAETQPAAAPRITLRRVSLMPLGAPSAPASPEGGFAIKGVTPGSYDVVVSPLPDGAYTKSIRFDNQEVTRKHLSLASPGELDVLISARGAQVSGTVNDRQGQPEIDTSVALWKPGPVIEDDADFTRVVRTDSEGRFTFSGLPPGDYRLAAWEEAEMGLLQYAPFRSQFEGTATRVRLDEGAQQTVDPVLIPADAIRAAEARVQ